MSAGGTQEGGVSSSKGNTVSFLGLGERGQGVRTGDEAGSLPPRLQREVRVCVCVGSLFLERGVRGANWDLLPRMSNRTQRSAAASAGRPRA